MTGSGFVIKNAFVGFVGASFIICNATSGAVNSEITRPVGHFDTNSHNVENLTVSNASGSGSILYTTKACNERVMSIKDIKLNSLSGSLAIKIDENNSDIVLNKLAYNGESKNISDLKVTHSDLTIAAVENNISASSDTDMFFIRTDLIAVPKKKNTPVESQKPVNNDVKESDDEKNKVLDNKLPLPPSARDNSDFDKNDVSVIKKSVEATKEVKEDQDFSVKQENTEVKEQAVHSETKNHSEIKKPEEKSLAHPVSKNSNNVNKKSEKEELELDNIDEIKLQLSPKTEINTPFIPSTKENNDAINQELPVKEETKKEVKEEVKEEINTVNKQVQKEVNQELPVKEETKKEVKEEVKEEINTVNEQVQKEVKQELPVKVETKMEVNNGKAEHIDNSNIKIPVSNPIKIEFNNDVIFPKVKNNTEQKNTVKNIQPPNASESAAEDASLNTSVKAKDKAEKSDDKIPLQSDDKVKPSDSKKTLKSDTKVDKASDKKPATDASKVENSGEKNSTINDAEVKAPVTTKTEHSPDSSKKNNEENVSDSDIKQDNIHDEIVDERLLPEYTGNELENEEPVQQTETRNTALKHMTNNFNSCDFPKQEEKMSGLVKTRNKVVKAVVGRDLALSARTRKLVAENFGEERNSAYGSIYIAHDKNSKGYTLNDLSNSMEFDGAGQSQDNTEEKEVTINTPQDIINGKNIVGSNINFVKDTNVLQRKYAVLTGSNLMINVTDKGKFDIFGDKVFDLVMDSKNDAKYFDTNQQLPPYEENIKKNEQKENDLPSTLIKEDTPSFFGVSTSNPENKNDEDSSSNIEKNSETSDSDSQVLGNKDDEQVIQPKKSFFSKIFRKK